MAAKLEELLLTADVTEILSCSASAAACMSKPAKVVCSRIELGLAMKQPHQRSPMYRLLPTTPQPPQMVCLHADAVRMR